MAEIMETLSKNFKKPTYAEASVLQERSQKRDDALKDLKKTSKGSKNQHEENLYELRLKHAQQTKNINEELENVKKSKSSLENMKQKLEHENADLINDLKAVQIAKQESERRRRQVEQNCRELTVKLTEMESMKLDSNNRESKLQNELDQVTAQLEQTDAKLEQASAKNSSLETQLAEANALAGQRQIDCFGPESTAMDKAFKLAQEKEIVEKTDTSEPQTSCTTQSQTPKEVSTAQTPTNSCVFCDNQGIFYCYDCKLAFCTPCRDNHDKLPQSKTHSVTDLKSVNPSAVKLRCELHKSEFTFFCTPCNTLVCNLCVTSDHKEHGMSGIIEKSDEIKRLAKSKLSDMKSKLQNLSKAAEITKMIDIPKMDDESKMAVAKIRSIENDVQKLISTKADIKVNEVQDEAQWKKEELQSAWNNKERIHRKQTSIYESLETLLSEEHAVSFLVSYQTLEREMCDLTSEANDDIEPHHIQAPDLQGFLDETIHSLQDYKKRLE
ncbi:myosin heavy chain, non-muscle-like [Mytilus trossulus]|uniref:myosin heavy chain, non-muscle-like n=1 Tax=Mytilus trossulus TaxID=6551 RepID=UPI003005C213